MSSKEEFKKFVQNNPTLNKHVTKGDMTWQKFYEMYDLYGESSEVWNDYLRKDNVKNIDSISKINDLIKGVDMDSIKEHINTAQKALDFVQELTSKTSSVTNKVPIEPRPLNKFFED